MSRDHTWTMGSVCLKWFWRGFMAGAFMALSLCSFALAMWIVFGS